MASRAGRAVVATRLGEKESTSLERFRVRSNRLPERWILARSVRLQHLVANPQFDVQHAITGDRRTRIHHLAGVPKHEPIVAGLESRAIDGQRRRGDSPVRSGELAQIDGRAAIDY